LVFISPDSSLTASGPRVLMPLVRSCGWKATLVHFPNEVEKLRRVGAAQACREVRKLEPTLVGVSLQHTNYQICAAFSDEWQRTFPDVPLIWGGVLPTLEPELSLKHSAAVCIGEADESLPEFLSQINNRDLPRNIAGFWSWNEQTIVRNDLRPFPEELDSLPFPEFGWGGEFYWFEGGLTPLTVELAARLSPVSLKHYTVTGSRLCYRKCSYCAVPSLGRKIPGRVFRRRSPGNIIGEIKARMTWKPLPEKIIFMDSDLFASPSKWLEDLCTRYRQEIGLPFGAYASPTSLTGPRLEMMLDAGLDEISLGIQTASAVIMDAVYCRKVRDRTARYCTEILMPYRDRLSFVYFDLILDNPWESEAEKLDTAREINSLPRIFALNLYRLTLFPGTPLFERAVTEGKLCGQENIPYWETYPYGKTAINRLIRLLPEIPPWLGGLFIRLIRSTPGKAVFFAFYASWYGFLRWFKPRESDWVINRPQPWWRRGWRKLRKGISPRPEGGQSE
jgi:anaerobic magnesium-protoporphyrin IX monomethyl ester cyclase